MAHSKEVTDRVMTGFEDYTFLDKLTLEQKERVMIVARELLLAGGRDPNVVDTEIEGNSLAQRVAKYLGNISTDAERDEAIEQIRLFGPPPELMVDDPSGLNIVQGPTTLQ
jgi:hypothetical protein